MEETGGRKGWGAVMDSQWLRLMWPLSHGRRRTELNEATEDGPPDGRIRAGGCCGRHAHGDRWGASYSGRRRGYAGAPALDAAHA
ncbi:hypothetical protein HYQ46_007252 [Verticillium longisporum]|nr:hypothetical protein HYQ46_007252 [Verticillium longisporum]